MDELTIGDKIYVSSKRAAEISGYAKDYIGQLCREGRVEARLVGRNWYVLEASLKNHRFGAPERPPYAEKIAENQATTWMNPTYSTETAPFIPPMLERDPIPDSQKQDVAVSLSDVERSRVLSDMQSAWHEWFTGKQTLELEEAVAADPEELLEAPKTLYEPVPMERNVPTGEESEGIPVLIERIHEKSASFQEDAEEIVPIHRSYGVPQGTLRPVGVETATYAVKKSSRKHLPTTPNIVLNALFLSVAGFAVVITVIASGYVDHYIDQSRVGAAPLKFFSGISEYTAQTNR